MLLPYLSLLPTVDHSPLEEIDHSIYDTSIDEAQYNMNYELSDWWKLSETFKTNKLLIENGSKKYDTIHIVELNLSSKCVTGDDRLYNEYVYGEEGLT